MINEGGIVNWIQNQLEIYLGVVFAKNWDGKIWVFNLKILWIFQMTLYANWTYGLLWSIDFSIWRFSLGINSGYWENGTVGRS